MRFVIFAPADTLTDTMHKNYQNINKVFNL